MQMITIVYSTFYAWLEKSFNFPEIRIIKKYSKISILVLGSSYIQWGETNIYTKEKWLN